VSEFVTDKLGSVTIYHIYDTYFDWARCWGCSGT